MLHYILFIFFYIFVRQRFKHNKFKAIISELSNYLMKLNIKEWYDKMREGEVLLAYKGDITPALITNVLEIVESKLEDTEAAVKVKKKVYFVLVECLQNLFHHIDVPNRNKEEEKFAMFIIARSDTTYKISTGNFVVHENINVLKEKMDKVNSLTRDELKSLYKVVLNNNTYSSKGGGGLGLIDIVRKTGSKLEYKFHNYNKEFAFFSLNINISQLG